MENAPFYIQPSIELPFEQQSSVPWGQPPPLPPQTQRYSSTPWSDRPQSETTTPLPQTPRLRAPRTPRTRTGTQSVANPLPRGSPGKHLTDDDRLHILRLAIQAGDSWGHCTKKVFWQNIANSFEAATSKRHTTLSRAVDDIVKARRKYLAKNDSGEEDKATSYSDAIDDWISIVDDRKALEQAQKDAQGIRDGESQQSIKWREDGLKLWADKTQLAKLAKKRKR